MADAPTEPPTPKACEFCWHGYHGTVLCQELYDPGWTANKAKIPCSCVGRAERAPTPPRR